MENQKTSLVQNIKTIGLLPALRSGMKSLLLGDSMSGDGVLQDLPLEGGFTTQTFFQRFTGTHTFNRQALIRLVDTGYTNNPAGFGIIQKILLAQRNIKFIPYWNGKPWKSKTLDLDLNFALQMLICCGTVFVYKKKIIGFPDKLVVLNTLDITETYTTGGYSYRLNLRNGYSMNLSNDDLIIIKIFDLTRYDTQMGLSPFQAALMPLESLREMYTADTATLKNKGVDVLITNDSEVPIKGDEALGMDAALNQRIQGARRAGGVATSTAKLRVLNLGRTAKELALWDGYKIKIRDLCNVLQIDSGQLNDPDNKKFANVQESNKALYNDCVIPFTKLITENKELQDALGFEIYMDVSGVDCLQEAQTVRAEKAQIITNTIVALNTSVRMGDISPDIAVRLLVSEWQFDEAEARLLIMVPDTSIVPIPDPNLIPAGTDPELDPLAAGTQT